MAKVRVYELAKELNLESKKLVEKLQAGGLSIKNYMSTLDEEAISKAKEIVSGAVSQVIEERRIKPTVIRRRKKTVKVKQDIPEAEIEEKEREEKVEAPRPEPTPDELKPKEIAGGRVVTIRERKKEAEVEKPAEGKGVSEEELLAEEVKREPPPKKVARLPAKPKVKRKKAKKKKAEQPANAPIGTRPG